MDWALGPRLNFRRSVQGRVGPRQRWRPKKNKKTPQSRGVKTHGQCGQDVGPRTCHRWGETALKCSVVQVQSPNPSNISALGWHINVFYETRINLEIGYPGGTWPIGLDGRLWRVHRGSDLKAISRRQVRCSWTSTQTRWALIWVHVWITFTTAFRGGDK